MVYKTFQIPSFHYRTSLEYASLYSRGGMHPPLPAIRALGSALYDNPSTLLNGHLRQSTQQQLQQRRLNINNLKSTHLSSHEHSDSGLSAESHEYSPYNSERLVLFVADQQKWKGVLGVINCFSYILLYSEKCLK